MRVDGVGSERVVIFVLAVSRSSHQKVQHIHCWRSFAISATSLGCCGVVWRSWKQCSNAVGGWGSERHGGKLGTVLHPCLVRHRFDDGVALVSCCRQFRSRRTFGLSQLRISRRLCPGRQAKPAGTGPWLILKIWPVSRAVADLPRAIVARDGTLGNRTVYVVRDKSGEQAVTSLAISPYRVSSCSAMSVTSICSSHDASSLPAWTVVWHRVLNPPKQGLAHAISLHALLHPSLPPPMRSYRFYEYHSQTRLPLIARSLAVLHSSNAKSTAIAGRRAGEGELVLIRRRT